LQISANQPDMSADLSRKVSTAELPRVLTPILIGGDRPAP